MPWVGTALRAVRSPVELRTTSSSTAGSESHALPNAPSILSGFRSPSERLLVKAMGFGLTLFFGRRYSIYLEPSSAAFKGAASSGGDCFAKFAAMNLWRFTISAGAIVRIFARG
jgi:hypothetical protein